MSLEDPKNGKVAGVDDDPDPCSQSRYFTSVSGEGGLGVLPYEDG